MRRRIFTPVLTLCCALLAFWPGSAEGASPEMQTESPISAGVVHESYHWATSYGPIQIEVLRCDLNNPGFHIEVLPGAGEYTRRATVSQMASQYQPVAVTNGDFFNMALQGSPIGPSIVDGKLETSPANIIGLHHLGIDRDGKAHIEAMQFHGEVTAADGARFPIAGLNKTYYWHDPGFAESHTNTIQGYSDFWGSPSRGHKNHTELLVNQEGIVERISWGASLPYEVPDTKTILQVHGLAEDFVRAHVPEGSRVRIDYGVQPDRGWTFLIGGHGLLVDQGKKVPYTKDLSALAGIRARTFVGISEDGKTLWIATAQGRTGSSVGLSLDSMGYFMQDLGAWRAVNLDGGGSTTMVAKDLGSFQYDTKTYPEGFGRERPVANGIGIFNRAPEGPPVGMQLSGPERALIGQTVSFAVDRAWDANYHPKDPSAFSLTWSDNGSGIWSGGYYLPLQVGPTTIRAHEAGGGLATKTLEVQGPEGMQSLELSIDSQWVDGLLQSYPQLTAVGHDGRRVLISPKVAQWRLEGFHGGIDPANDLLTAEAQADQALGALVAQVGHHESRVRLYNAAYDIVELHSGSADYRVNGSPRRMDVTPIVQFDRTLVPLRFVAEAMGAQVEWDVANFQAQVFYQGRELAFPIDEFYAFYDGEKVNIDAPARLAENRTLVPLRLIGESMGLQVEYDHDTRSVFLIK